jgi:hypothetical protein
MMMKGNEMITESQVLRLVATSTFEPFDMYDFDSFAGVTSGNPMICNTDKFVLILDGSTISYINGDDEEFTFHLEAQED